MPNCPSCQTDVPQPNAKFCGKCGAALSAPTRSAGMDSRFVLAIFSVLAMIIVALFYQNMRLASQIEQALAQVNSSAQTSSPTVIQGARDPAQMEDPHGWNPSQMVFSAVLCPCKGCEDQLLLNCSCTQCSEKTKAEIQSQIDAGKGISTVFDAFVAKYGEKFLTEEARQIRRMRGK